MCPLAQGKRTSGFLKPGLAEFRIVPRLQQTAALRFEEGLDDPGDWHDQLNLARFRSQLVSNRESKGP